MTSATLAADRRFDLLLARTGLAYQRPAAVTLALPSPFDHAEQAILGVVPQMPDPRDDGGQHHTQALISAVDQLTRSASGGTLVLFTSFRHEPSLCSHRGLLQRASPMIRHEKGPVGRRFCSAFDKQRMRFCSRQIHSGKVLIFRVTPYAWLCHEASFRSRRNR